MQPTSTFPTHAGHTVHLRESAGEGPLVLLCGGAGVVVDYWDAVTALMPDLHWAALDRPGLGGTPWPRELPTLDGSVQLLREVVTSLGAPAIVVAQSMAGYHAEALARRHPDLVAGLVLVDTTVSFPTQPPREIGVPLAKAVHRLARVRPLRALGGQIHQLGAAVLTKDSSLVLRRRRYRRRYADADTLAAVIGEYSAWGSQGWDLLSVRSSHPYPDIPTVVLTSATTGGRDWLAKQNRLARMLGARQVVSDEAGHMLMVDQPELLVDAVRSIRRQLRGR